MEKDALKKFGANVKRIRKEKGMKQVVLGELCDMERSNMYRIETGGTNPTLLTILKISKALEVSPCDLLHGIG